jgi:hypothetical protein
MSRQLTFYLLPDVLDAMLDEIVSDAETVLLSQSGETIRPATLASDDQVVYLCPAREREGVVRSLPPADHVDDLRSPVVEVHRGLLREMSTLVRGRLYYSTEFYEGTQLAQKSETFKMWATAILTFFRRKLQKRSFGYIDRETLDWIRSGDGRLFDGFQEVPPETYLD